MRSNIACTCVSGNVPDAGAPPLTGQLLVVALQRRDVRDQLVELVGLLLAQRLEGRHRRGRVDQRPGDRVLAEPVPDVGQVGPERVAVLADLVAAETAGRGGDLLALLVLR